MARQFLRMQGMRIATAPAGPRNDSAFLHSAPILVRIVVFLCHCEEPPKGGDVAIRCLAMRSIVSGHRPDNSIPPR